MPIPFAFASSMLHRAGFYGAEVAGGRSFAKAAAASLTGGPQARADADAPKKAAEAADKAGKSTKDWTERVREFRDSATQAAARFLIFRSVFEGSTGHLTGALTTTVSALHSLASPLAELTELASPAHVRLFNLAFRDAMAVVGRAGIPAMQAFTRAMEKAGDTLVAFEPQINHLLTTFATAVERTFDRLNKVATDNANAVSLTVGAFESLVQSVESNLAVVLAFTNAMAKSSALFNLFGASKPNAGTAKGSAIQDVQISNSGAEFARRAQEKAFTQAIGELTGAKQAEPETEKDVLTKILEFLDTNLATDKIRAIIDGLITGLLPGGAGGNAGRGVLAGAADATPGADWTAGLLAGMIRGALTR